MWHVHVHVPVQACKPHCVVCGRQSGALCIFHHRLPYCLETGHLTELEAHSLGWLESELWNHIPIYPSMLGLRTLVAMPVFMWVVTVPVLVLVSAGQALLSTELSLKHSTDNFQIERVLPLLRCFRD